MAANSKSKNYFAPADDIEFILEHFRTNGAGLRLRNQSILLTGGTGFFGKWLTQTLIALNDRLNLKNQLTIVTRNRSAAEKSLPWLQNRKDVSFIECDIRHLESDQKFETIIHGAAAASQTLNENSPEIMFETILEGTRRVLKIAESAECKNFQFISSGAVYGLQPTSIDHIDETFMGAPDLFHPQAAYGEAKRAAEFLAISAGRRLSMNVSIPRCYAFVGPYLPLDIHFAIGNFIKNILDNVPIHIGGDGTPLRSYLYAADLMVWLLEILDKTQGQRAYNVGSDASFSIRQVAGLVNEVGLNFRASRNELREQLTIARAANPSLKPARYVPSIERARQELGLDIWTKLDDAVLKTLRWYDSVQ